MSNQKELILYGSGPSPNPIKVAVLLEELGIAYKVEQVAEKKQEPYISLNPNGRVPALKDPNTDVIVFESGACLEYLVATYDKDNKFNYPTGQEHWTQQAFLHFQMSGQGPYFGQFAWFSMFHHENLPSAIDRYSNEIKRVSGVIDAHLKKTGKPNLVGDKVSFADLAWIPWYKLATSERMIGGSWNWKEELPFFAKWATNLFERPAVKKVYEKAEFQMP